MPKFKKGDILVVTSNKWNKEGNIYHSIPVGSVVKVINSDSSRVRILGDCYYVCFKKEDTYQHVYERSLRLFAPFDLSKELNKEQLPNF